MILVTAEISFFGRFFVSVRARVAYVNYRAHAATVVVSVRARVAYS